MCLCFLHGSILWTFCGQIFIYKKYFKRHITVSWYKMTLSDSVVQHFVAKFLYIKNILKGTSPWADSVMQNVWVAIIIVKITQDSEAVPYFLNCFFEPTLVCILQEYYYYDIWCIILSQNAVTKTWYAFVMQNIWVAFVIIKISQDSEAVPYFLNCFL